MSDEEEYEVEKILQARVSRKGGKKSWQYLVKWKGYDKESDNTWEPTTSFEDGSSHFIETFWASANESRDYTELSQFKVNEVFVPVPVGPPGKRRNLNKKPVLTLKDPEPEPVPRHRSRHVTPKIGPPTRGAKRPNHEIDEPAPTPVTKRSRRPLTAVEPELGQPSPAVRQQPVAGPSSGKRRGPPGVRPAAADKPTTASSSKQKLPTPAATSDEDKNGDAQPSDPTSLFSGSDPASPPVVVGPPKRRTSMRNSPKKQNKAPEPETVSIGPPRRKPSEKAKDSMPAHRARKANPKVKLMDVHVIPDSYSGSISTKARFFTGSGSNSASRASGSTSGSKGTPQVASGKVRGIVSVPLPKPAVEDVTVDVQMEDETIAPSDEGDIEISSANPPTGSQLLDMAGFDKAAAEELPDFDDDGDVPKPAEEQQPNGADSTANDVVPTPTSPVQLESLSHGPLSMWNSESHVMPNSTIFGPLGFSRSIVAGPSSESISSFNKVLSIKLDTAVIVPVVLKDIQPPKSTSLKALDVVISNITGGSTAGKFYKGENAPALISTLRVEGSCARIALQEDATEGQKADYERFQAHLQAGHLFVITFGLTTLALCSSENQDLCTRLSISPKLIGLGGNVLVTEVAIADDQAFCDAVINAEDERW